MLILSRKIGEIITVGSTIRITVLGFERGNVRLGIDAPKSIPIHRQEVYEKIIEKNKQAAKTELSAFKNAISQVGVDFTDEDLRQLQIPSLLRTQLSEESAT